MTASVCRHNFSMSDHIADVSCPSVFSCSITCLCVCERERERERGSASPRPRSGCVESIGDCLQRFPFAPRMRSGAWMLDTFMRIAPMQSLLDRRRACTRKEICRLPAGVQARKVPGHQTLAGPESSVRPIGGPCGVRQSPIEHACLRQSPIEQDLHGRDAHECVQHPGASTHSWCER